ncbi:hypothetical protein [Citrobacter phage Tr1]|nr:hypothetical protein [Citrobacter phage Tr1]
MKKDIQDLTVFDLGIIDGEATTLYHDNGDTYMYLGAERYSVSRGAMALMREGIFDNFEDKFQGFNFTHDIRLDGQIAILQEDAFYMVVFVTPKFSGINDGVKGALNDVVVLKLGDALEDLEKM